MSWPPGSCSKRLRDIRENDEVLVELMFRTVESWEDTPKGFVVHFKDRDVPPRTYPGPNTTVTVWDARLNAPPAPIQMSI
ncbi:hypothetical protein [Catenulispora rubra]|uniref:hypothetical protein n=1 Tax=Catenulispora rubra TaxID=280293 RepID=UPI001892754F|nr:hypothetical protein [Catenulispora rubra]